MNTLAHADTFFIISSVGFVLLWILASIFFIYLIRTMRVVSRILKNAEGDIDKLGDTAKDMLLDIKESLVFQFLFRKKRSRSKSKE